MSRLSNTLRLDSQLQTRYPADKLLALLRENKPAILAHLRNAAAIGNVRPPEPHRRCPSCGSGLGPSDDDLALCFTCRWWVERVFEEEEILRRFQGTRQADQVRKFRNLDLTIRGGAAVTLVSPNVVSGSFVVHRAGLTLRIELEVQRASASGGGLASRHGAYVIALRN